MSLRLGHCRRFLWLRFVKWYVFISVTVLISWTHRSWFIHGYRYTMSSSYRACESRRRSYTMGDDNNQELYVTMADHGRLGNWMYQYASLLGIAQANGRKPYFLATHPLADGFQLTHTLYPSADCLVTMEDQKPLGYAERYNHLPEANISLNGYFQSWKYFDHIQNEIRREFRLSKYLDEKIRKRYQDRLGQYVAAGRVVISIHVRRGDIESFGARRLGYRSPPTSYYVNAMRYMVKKHPYCVFVVVSDDPEWCGNNIDPVTLRYQETGGMAPGKHLSKEGKLKPGGKIFVGYSDSRTEGDDIVYNSEELDEIVTSPEILEKLLSVTAGNGSSGRTVKVNSPPLVILRKGPSITDFGLLTLSNHSILSLGTFGWWGAWLAGGDVVYYRDWLVEGHIVHSQWTPGDFYPPHWVALSASRTLSFQSNIFSLCVFVIFVSFSVKAFLLI